MLEFLENEAKERRRMFGNITFMGQLFRHDLIVPRILNWCIIHLLKNHTESEVSADFSSILSSLFSFHMFFAQKNSTF